MKVWNKRDPNTPKDAIYVGRPTKWGNPFRVGDHYGPGHGLTQQEAVEAYRSWLTESLKQLAQTELRGKDLICWCAPLPCHADVLLELAND